MKNVYEEFISFHTEGKGYSVQGIKQIKLSTLPDSPLITMG